MKKWNVFILFIVISIFAIGQTSGITICFIKEGKEQELNNNFDVYFVYIQGNEKIIYKSDVNKDVITLPSLMKDDKDLRYHILFKYEGKIYYVDYVHFLFFCASKGWMIEFDKKPYKDPYNWEQEENNDKIKGGISITYGMGDAAVGYTLIKDFKEYFKKGKQLLEL